MKLESLMGLPTLGQLKTHILELQQALLENYADIVDSVKVSNVKDGFKLRLQGPLVDFCIDIVRFDDNIRMFAMSPKIEHVDYMPEGIMILLKGTNLEWLDADNLIKHLDNLSLAKSRGTNKLGDMIVSNYLWFDKLSHLFKEHHPEFEVKSKNTASAPGELYRLDIYEVHGGKIVNLDNVSLDKHGSEYSFRINHEKVKTFEDAMRVLNTPELRGEQ